MTPQELKNSILQLAIEGKLVEQRPEEGTGEELYREIQVEKQKLIEEGKIKKEKPLPEITEDEIPFEIPEGWKWVRLIDCGSFISGYTPKAKDLSTSGEVPYFKVADMNTKGNELYLSISLSFLKNKEKKIFLKNTIVYPKNGGAVFTNKKRILSQNSVVDLNTGGYYPFSPLFLMYVYLYFSMIDFRQYYKGTALPTIDMDKLKSKLIPIPPLAEQKRIVAKIEELLPLVDRYEKAWTRLEDFNRRFPIDMQKSILQLAIEGKLVPQRPEEGTGEALYEEIQAEKQKLIKAGKLKKEKPLPDISPDEIPFEIPESWKWVHIADVIELLSGTDLKPSQYNSVNKGIPYITGASNIDNSQIIINRWTSEPKRIAHKGDLLLTCKGTIGKTAILQEDSVHIARQLMSLQNTRFLDMKYLKYFIDYIAESLRSQGQGVIPGIDRSLILLHYFPLPPLAEQKRIVAKIEELLPLCERLK